MLLRGITLENIRSYKQTTLSLSEGTTLLFGDIGSGKTTILLATEFALFGILRGEQSGNILLRHGERAGSVSLTCTIADKDVTIKRTLKRGKNGVAQNAGTLTINGVTEQYTPVELKARIIELLGYPQEYISKNSSVLFRYTVYCPQESMTAILYDGGDERLNTLRVLFNIDKYKRVLENGQLLLRDLKQAEAELQAKTEDLLDYEARQEAITKRLAQAKKELSSQQKTLEEVNEQLAACATIMKEGETIERERLQLQQNIHLSQARLQDKYEQQRKTQEQLDIITKKIITIQPQKTRPLVLVKAEVEEAEKRLNTILANKLTIQKQLAEKETEQKYDPAIVTARLVEARGEHKRLEAILGKRTLLEKEQSILDDSKTKLLRNIGALTQKIEELTNKQQKLTTASTCPVCEQPITPEHKISVEKELKQQLFLETKKRDNEQQYKIQVTKTADKLKIQVKQIHDAEVQYSKLTEHIKTLEQQQKTSTELLKKITALQELKIKYEAVNIETLRITLNQLKEEYDRTLQETQRTERIEELKNESKQLQTVMHDNSKEITLLNGTITKETEKLKELPLTNLQAQQELHANLQLQHTEKATTLARVEQDTINLTEQQESLTLVLDKKQEAQTSLKKLQERKAWLDDFFLPAIAAIEKQLLMAIHHQCNELFKHWTQLLIDEEQLTARLDENFSPIIEQNGYDSSIQHLSGGERTSIALAYRLALNQVINTFMGSINTKNVLILDEPTDGFSQEQLDKMQDVFSQLNTQQVIIVSHEKKMENFVNNIIHIEKLQHESKANSSID